VVIAGCGQSLVDLLTARLKEANQLGDFDVALMAPREITKNLENRIALILYRIEADPTRRHVELARATPSSPARVCLGLDLHYLLAVWGKGSAAGEQITLGHCMEILDQNAVLTGPLLSADYLWDPSDLLKVTLDTVAVDDMWRLWEGIDTAYQLSVPYLVRTALLSPVERIDAPLADTRTLVFAPAMAS
jgi:hypothetical protein